MEFYYNGLCSRDFGLKIKSKNDLDSPNKNVEEIKVPGRNGSLFIDDDDYDNKVIDIVCLVDLRDKNEKEIAGKLNEWLLKDSKYKRLEFSDDFGYYYEAVCVNKINFNEILNNYYEILISFSCKPFKMSDMDKIKIVDKGWKVYNDSGIEAMPIIRIKKSSSGALKENVKLYINNQAITITMEAGKLYELNCELMNLTVIDGDFIENANDKFIDGYFPVLEEGENIIDWLGQLEYIEIDSNLRYF